jgi:hypothetical protein
MEELKDIPYITKGFTVKWDVQRCALPQKLFLHQNELQGIILVSDFSTDNR